MLDASESIASVSAIVLRCLEFQNTFDYLINFPTSAGPLSKSVVIVSIKDIDYSIKDLLNLLYSGSAAGPGRRVRPADVGHGDFGRLAAFY